MTRTAMPIMGATLLSEIPWAFLAPHEAQAIKNHSQTLNRLAERGGLAASEAIDIFLGNSWNTAKSCIENERWLVNKVREWRLQRVRYICPVCRAGGANPRNLTPFCHECPEQVLMVQNGEIT